MVRNRDLLAMVSLRRAAKPLDLMTYAPQDEQPSLFLLQEDKRQSRLAVFNWTEALRSHQFSFGDLGLTTSSTRGSTSWIDRVPTGPH
jgi:alpha-galactosidase